MPGQHQDVADRRHRVGRDAGAEDLRQRRRLRRDRAGELQRDHHQPDREPEQQPDRRLDRPASARNGRAGSGAASSGASIGQTTRLKATRQPQPHPRRDHLLAEARAAAPSPPPTRAKTSMKPASPASVRSSSAREPLEHQASPSTAGRALVPISSKREHRVADALGGQHRVQEAPALGRGDDRRIAPLRAGVGDLLGDRVGQPVELGRRQRDVDDARRPRAAGSSGTSPPRRG